MFKWLFGSSEKDKAAAKIQAHYRGKKTRSDFAYSKGDLNEAKVRRESAAAKIGAHFRGTRTRSVVGQKRGERQFMEAQEKSGILEKRSARKSFIMGSRQIVLWQRRYVRIDNFHFCYSSKVPKKGHEPDPKRDEKRIHLLNITDILTVEGMDEFIIVTSDAQYHFHCASAVENQSWINTISLLQAYLKEPTTALGGAQIYMGGGPRGA